mmetsp:Transcript_8271/g.10835  ORF Transcript_8271/g.10835 Transcript_8271/m.10835 type:complete len:209 (+) Transcript_8271:150-776(+)|eukprot:CAMPEP_0198143668 /NCGR_PEP_ID=MMETSP1443-20131203/9089_1 /TAXON_ID=186043 /ORGANISM="Entomoneis sp., Strain CCMP2396" /LENGTH=208 /DNA_ID=CAMNT_0043806939 /DNA_START=52 /DNA_END=678 /DNA_ORIENTATION=+
MAFIMNTMKTRFGASSAEFLSQRLALGSQRGAVMEASSRSVNNPSSSIRPLLCQPCCLVSTRTIFNNSFSSGGVTSSALPKITHSADIRPFHSESNYHNIADESLEALVDAVEAALESCSSSAIEDFEVTLAAGVLTISIPPHGTWVINKQTPNQQLWWSSPLSGPKRYEYDEADDVWFSTKDGLYLVPLLAEELSHITGETIDLKFE